MLVIDCVKTIDIDFRQMIENFSKIVKEAGDRMPSIVLVLNKVLYHFAHLEFILD